MYYTNVKNTIKDWAEDDRPREKLLMKGSSVLSDAELLAILIRNGTKMHSALDLAKAVLDTADYNLDKLARLSAEDLMRVRGVGSAKAVGILAAMELARRKRNRDVGKSVFVKSSGDAYEHMKPFMLDLTHEEFWIICLSRRMEVRKTVRVSSGGISGTFVDPKIVYRTALQNSINAILLCHNHPSGNTNPSSEDIALTKKLKTAGTYLDIEVADHLIFTDKGYYSFADNGIL